MRRAPRIALTGVAVALAVAGLTGCRTSPNVAAYVGDETITVDELQTAVDARLRNDTVAAFAAKDQAAFTRQVLSVLVLREVYAAAVEHFGVDEVTDGDALDYLTSLAGDAGQAGVEQQFAQAAEQGLTRDDLIQLARDQVVQAEVAQATGKSDRPSEAVLRARYSKDIAQYANFQLGYITVPDQTTAAGVLAQLQAQPQTYPALAQTYAGPYTLPQLTSYAAADIPLFADQVKATDAGSGFTAPVQQFGGVVVCYVASITPAPFEQVRDQVARSVQNDAEAAGQKVLADFRDDLDVTVNPRYGVLKEQLIVPETEGVVHILGGASSTTSPSATTGG